MKTSLHLRSYLAQLVSKSEMFLTKVVEKIKTHFMYSNLFFFYENRAVYEIMRKTTGYRWQYGACACAFHAGYLRLQTHTQYNLMFF